MYLYVCRNEGISWLGKTLIYYVIKLGTHLELSVMVCMRRSAFGYSLHLKTKKINVQMLTDHKDNLTTSKLSTTKDRDFQFDY